MFFRRVQLFPSSSASRASAGYSVIEEQLEKTRSHDEFVAAGHVLMPEHVHLLVSEPKVTSLATAMQVLKQQTSRLLKQPGEKQFWRRRYYDLNVHNPEMTTEKLRYMHRNPVKRGLVSKPEDWVWSSFRHYACGLEGVVEIESEWTARSPQQRGSLVGDPGARRHELGRVVVSHP